MVKEYDLFVPVNYNDGTPIEAEKLERIQSLLLDEFQGLTYFAQRNEGYWKMGNVTYRDEIVIFRVITERGQAAREFLERLKNELKKDLEQEEILIVERDVDTL